MFKSLCRNVFGKNVYQSKLKNFIVAEDKNDLLIWKKCPETKSGIVGNFVCIVKG